MSSLPGTPPRERRMRARAARRAALAAMESGGGGDGGDGGMVSGDVGDGGGGSGGGGAAAIVDGGGGGGGADIVDGGGDAIGAVGSVGERGIGSGRGVGGADGADDVRTLFALLQAERQQREEAEKRADAERQRADAERQRADAERQRAHAERQHRADAERRAAAAELKYEQLDTLLKVSTSVPSHSSQQLRHMREWGILQPWATLKPDFESWGLCDNADCRHLIDAWLALNGSGAREVDGVTPVAAQALRAVARTKGTLCSSVSKDTLPNPFKLRPVHPLLAAADMRTARYADLKPDIVCFLGNYSVQFKTPHGDVDTGLKRMVENACNVKSIIELKVQGGEKSDTQGSLRVHNYILGVMWANLRRRMLLACTMSSSGVTFVKGVRSSEFETAVHLYESIAMPLEDAWPYVVTLLRMQPAAALGLPPDTAARGGVDIVQFLGMGATASVFAAARVDADGSVGVLKVFDGTNAETAAALCANEVHVLERLRGVSGVPTLLRAWNTESGMRCILTTPRCTPLNDPIRLLEVIQILKDIHTLGFVHRDVRPSNILADPDGAAHLVDVGFAVASGTVCDFAGSLAFTSERQRAAADGAAAAAPSDDLVALVNTSAALVDADLREILKQWHFKDDDESVTFLDGTWDAWYCKNDVAWRRALACAGACDYDGLDDALRLAIGAALGK